MGMNFISGCHRCKTQVFHFRGCEDEVAIVFFEEFESGFRIFSEMSPNGFGAKKPTRKLSLSGPKKNAMEVKNLQRKSLTALLDAGPIGDGKAVILIRKPMPRLTMMKCDTCCVLK